MGKAADNKRAVGVHRLLLALVMALGTVTLRTGAERIPSGMGPFRVELRGQNVCPASEKCYRPEKVDVTNMRVVKDPSIPYKYSYNADVNSTLPLSDSDKVEIRVSKWNTLTNGWTNNVFRMTIKNPCSLFKSNRPDIFKQVSDVVYDGTVTDCPLPPVTKQVRDFAVESKPPETVKQLPYGRFRSRTKTYDANQECFLCMEVIVDILPKH